jgi:hypothetical protein
VSSVAGRYAATTARLGHAMLIFISGPAFISPSTVSADVRMGSEHIGLHAAGALHCSHG